MIEITIDHNKTQCSIEIKGHANYAEKGKDIVCASVSSIIEYIIRFADLINELREGTASYICMPGEAKIKFSLFKEYSLKKKIDNQPIDESKEIYDITIYTTIMALNRFFEDLSNQYIGYISYKTSVIE